MTTEADFQANSRFRPTGNRPGILGGTGDSRFCPNRESDSSLVSVDGVSVHCRRSCRQQILSFQGQSRRAGSTAPWWTAARRNVTLTGRTPAQRQEGGQASPPAPRQITLDPGPTSVKSVRRMQRAAARLVHRHTTGCGRCTFPKHPGQRKWQHNTTDREGGAWFANFHVYKNSSQK